MQNRTSPTLLSTPSKLGLSAARLSPAPSAALALLLGLAACAGGADKGAGGGGDDTAGSDGGDGGGDYEEGCITVDGEGGYKWINDAIAVASEGSTITLCAEAAHEEAVVVDKGVSIVGPGVADFLLVAPTNEDGVTITAAGASLSGMSIETTRSGVAVTAASGVTISAIEVSAAGNWGIEAAGASDLSLSDVAISGGGYGGVSIDGGSATVTGATLLGNGSFGLAAKNSATVTVTASSAEGTTEDDDTQNADGVGLYAEAGSSLTVTDVTVTSNSLLNIYCDESDLTASGVTSTGSSYGVAVIRGAVSLTDSVITDAQAYGTFLITPDPVSVSGLTISGDPALTADVSDADWGKDSVGYPGVGLYIVSGSIDVTSSSVTGYNDAGMLLSAYDETGGSAYVEGLTLTNNGRHGAYVMGLAATVLDTHITGLIEVEDQTGERCGYVDRYTAWAHLSGSLDWQGGSVIGNAGYGISGIQALVNVSGATISDNACGGVLNFQGSLVASGNTFSASGAESWLSASVVDYQGTSTGGVYDNTFVDSQAVQPTTQEYSYEYDDGTGTGTTITTTYRWEYRQPQGFDVFGAAGAGLDVSGNTFQRGVNGVYLQNMDGTVTDNTWEGYMGSAVYAYGTGQVEVSDNVIDGGPYAIQCQNAEIEITDTTLTGGSPYAYEYDFYVDDVFQSTASSEYIGYAFMSYNCQIRMDGVEFVDLQPSPMYFYNYDGAPTAELNDIRVENVCLSDLSYNAAMQIYNYGGTPAFYLSDVSIKDVGYAQGVYFYSSVTTALEATNLVIENTPSEGIYLYDATGAGGLTAYFTGGEISGASSYGMTAYNANVVIDGLSVHDNASSGVYLASTTGSFKNNNVNANSSYGLVCSNATIDDCSGNDLTGNTAGELSGCPEACATALPE
jgi:hypothetical protein